MVLFHNISGVPRKGKLGKAHTVFADAAGLFCCNETAALFKQAVHEPIFVYNVKAWQKLLEVCVRFRLNTTDKFDYKTYKLLTGITNDYKQQQKRSYALLQQADLFIPHLDVIKQHV